MIADSYKLCSGIRTNWLQHYMLCQELLAMAMELCTWHKIWGKPSNMQQQYLGKALRNSQITDSKRKFNELIFDQSDKNPYATSHPVAYPQKFPHTYPQDMGITHLTT